MEKLEMMLAQWMVPKHQHAIPLSSIIIQVKVKSLFNPSRFMSD
jgi:hypothetical protein